MRRLHAACRAVANQDVVALPFGGSMLTLMPEAVEVR
jgi:hypothetical protein